ncbi:hypothetical protein HYDPIDRAFT_108450 [Hydnomerulius pinastri MD-312]|nr:hypothetical protein HYDPIDRAFT_108450 [Hydnomerulius pinastri MD-312]
MSGQVPFPSGSYVEAVRQSCKQLREAQDIEVTDEAIKRLLFSPSFLTTFKRVSGHHGLNFPLNFPSSISELNFLSVLSLLNFASGYRVPLHEQTGRGAWDNIRALAFGLYISSATGQGDLLSAKGMQSVTPQQIAELMSVKIHIERPHDKIQGITVGELGGPIYEVVNLISKTLNETGELLLKHSEGMDLGTFVLQSLQRARAKSNKGPNAITDAVLHDLVGAFPAFRDMAVVGGIPVYCFKKALFLIHAVTLRFGTTSSHSSGFPLPDTSQVPVFTDNVLPSLLVHLGVLDLSDSRDTGLQKIFPDAENVAKIDALLALPEDTPITSSSATPDAKPKKVPPKEGPVLTSDQAYVLRAAAVDACEKIIAYARSLDEGSLSEDQKWIKDITLPQLDMWLWAVAKDRTDYRELERFVLRDTVFF